MKHSIMQGSVRVFLSNHTYIFMDYNIRITITYVSVRIEVDVNITTSEIATVLLFSLR